jgi:hypothetical protein
MVNSPSVEVQPNAHFLRIIKQYENVLHSLQSEVQCSERQLWRT